MRVFPVILLATLLSAPAAHAQIPSGWDKPMHGVSAEMPPQWTSEYSPADTQMTTYVCHTAACESATQEVCKLIVTNKPIGLSGYLPSGWMVSLTIGAGKIRNSVLKGSHEGATLTKDPGTEWIGDQSWYTAESLAPYGWKSLFHATAVIDQRFIRVRCQTCDRSDHRFDFARQFLASVRVKP